MPRAVHRQSLGPGKTIAALCIVIGCFAILWPKMFYPMLMTAMKSSSTPDSVEPDQFETHPPFMKKHGKPAGGSRPYPDLRERAKTPKHHAGGQNSSLNFLVPFYTIAITIFFLYTIFKILWKKDEDETESVKRPSPRAPVTSRDALQKQLAQLAAAARYNNPYIDVSSYSGDKRVSSVPQFQTKKKAVLHSATQQLINQHGKHNVLDALNVLMHEFNQEGNYRQQLLEQRQQELLLSANTESANKDSGSGRSISPSVKILEPTIQEEEEPEIQEETMSSATPPRLSPVTPRRSPVTPRRSPVIPKKALALSDVSESSENEDGSDDEKKFSCSNRFERDDDFWTDDSDSDCDESTDKTTILASHTLDANSCINDIAVVPDGVTSKASNDSDVKFYYASCVPTLHVYCDSDICDDPNLDNKTNDYDDINVYSDANKCLDYQDFYEIKDGDSCENSYDPVNERFDFITSKESTNGSLQCNDKGYSSNGDACIADGGVCDAKHNEELSGVRLSSNFEETFTEDQLDMEVECKSSSAGVASVRQRKRNRKRKHKK